MTIFVGDYCSDLGKMYKHIGFKVIVINLVNDTIDNSLLDTNLFKYLPSFYSSLKLGSDCNYCFLDFSPRFLNLIIGESFKIKAVLPFCPLSSEFNQAFQEIKENNLITKVEYKGEKITDDYTEFLVKNV